jgi:hypothetical protein
LELRRYRYPTTVPFGTQTVRLPGRSAMSDYDLIEARHTISTLQSALDYAQALIRKQGVTIALLNERVATANNVFDGDTSKPKVEALMGSPRYRNAQPVPIHRQRRRLFKAVPLIFV